jgi:hypothetical protein
MAREDSVIYYYREAVRTLKHPIRGNQEDAIKVDTCYTVSGMME